MNSNYIYQMVAPLCNHVEHFKNNENEDQVATEKDTELDNMRIWIDDLKTCLIGENFHLFPVVKAAKDDEATERPLYMKFKDLPLYQSPHCANKEYVGDKIKCPDRNAKLLHRSLLPHVKDGLATFNKALFEGSRYIQYNTREVVESMKKSKNNFKQTMRDPDNLAVRRAVLTGGGLAGYMIGGGGGIPRRLFFTSAGLLSTGALCFPKETDKTFRNAAFVAAKTFLALYNKWCGKNFNLREKLACRDELLEQPPKRQPLKCPPK